MNTADSLQFNRRAPGLIKIVFQFMVWFLMITGKPVFIVLLTLLTITLQIINTTGYIVRYIYKIIYEKYSLKNIIGIRKKRGLVFLASRERFKSFLKDIRAKTEKLKGKCLDELNKYSKFLNNFIWKKDVFLIALTKLLTKFVLLAKSKIQPKKTVRVLFLKVSLFYFVLKSNTPKFKLPQYSFLRILKTSLLLIFIASFAMGAAFWYFILKELPSPEELTSRKRNVSTKIYDRHGTLLYNIYKDQNRTPVSLNEVPAQVKSATIAIEDAEFYSHPGFSVKGIARAIIKNYKEDRLTGGSTITQQLVKNTLLSPEKTYIRKLKEIILATQVELTFSKDEILEMYLNEVSYGGTSYGIQEAARTYFGKDVKSLSLAEAALLAGLPKSPTEYSPFGTNPELAFARQKEVLRLMELNGFITQEQRKSTESEEVKFIDQKTDIKAPHFVMYIRQLLEEQYGKSTIDTGGLEIITTLDYSIQYLAERTLKEELEKLVNLNVTNAAVVILKPQTGEILAMVGSKDYFDTEHDGNVNVVIRPRQPGSSIKVVNYALALSNGMSPATIIKDTPVTFLVEDQPSYAPQNYEGNYRGNVTLRSALAESRNIPAVRVLALYGVDKMIELGRKMGISTWHDPKNYGLSLTLGGGEVKLLDLALVYATLANYGSRPELSPFLKITDFNNNTIYEFGCSKKKEIMVAQASASDSALNKTDKSAQLSCKTEQVIDPRVAYLITDILKDNVARSPTFGSNSLLQIPGHPEVAVKTGTSNNLRDNLTVGYNQDYLVAVWVGNNDNSPMERIASGITGATPIWNKIMSALLGNEDRRDWPIPEMMVKIPICPYTGTLACQGCANITEWFLEENKPEKACRPEWFLAKENQDTAREGSKSPNQNPTVDEKSNFKPEIIDMQKKKTPTDKIKYLLGNEYIPSD